MDKESLLRMALLAWVQAHFIQRYSDKSVVSHNEGVEELLDIIRTTQEAPSSASDKKGD